VPLRPKYSQHPILKHPQPMFLSQCQQPSFIPIIYIYINKVRLCFVSSLFGSEINV
jgi:hypothetical protein